MSDKKETAYFKTLIHGLKVQVGEDPKDGTEPETVSFVPYQERLDGDRVKIGYLETDNAMAIEKLRADLNVEELDKSEYEQSTNTEREKNPAIRAAY